MCPAGFQWQPTTSKCYSSQVRRSILGTDIVKECKALHPEAIPVEPRNQAEMDIIQNLAGTSYNSAFTSVSINRRQETLLHASKYTYVYTDCHCVETNSLSLQFKNAYLYSNNLKDVLKMAFILTGISNLSPSEDTDTWLGIYRPNSSRILHDFKYYSDGTNITFQNWYETDPNDYRNEEDCVAIRSYRNYQWSDEYCGIKFSFICEL